MTTYRASLGTRGELRRIAAEAENATIERVRPWRRQVQPCKLAPHVIVPQWIRSELPPKPPTPPPPPTARDVASALLATLLENIASAAAAPPEAAKPQPTATRATTRQDTERMQTRSDTQMSDAARVDSAMAADAGVEAAGGDAPAASAAASATTAAAEAALAAAGTAPLPEPVPPDTMEVDSVPVPPADVVPIAAPLPAVAQPPVHPEAAVVGPPAVGGAVEVPAVPGVPVLPTAPGFPAGGDMLQQTAPGQMDAAVGMAEPAMPLGEAPALPAPGLDSVALASRLEATGPSPIVEPELPPAELAEAAIEHSEMDTAAEQMSLSKNVEETITAPELPGLAAEPGDAADEPPASGLDASREEVKPEEGAEDVATAEQVLDGAIPDALGLGDEDKMGAVVGAPVAPQQEQILGENEAMGNQMPE